MEKGKNSAYPQLVCWKVTDVIIQEDRITWFFVVWFNLMDENGLEIEISHHMSQAFVPDTIKGCFEVNKIIVQVTLVMEVHGWSD